MNTIRFIVLRAVAILVLLLGIIHAARGTPDQHPHTVEKRKRLF